MVPWPALTLRKYNKETKNHALLAGLFFASTYPHPTSRRLEHELSCRFPATVMVEGIDHSLMDFAYLLRIQKKSYKCMTALPLFLITFLKSRPISFSRIRARELTFPAQGRLPVVHQSRSF